MLTEKCRSCKYCAWLVGVGQGVRCFNEYNQKYKSSDDKGTRPVVISKIPDNCELYEIKIQDKKQNGDV